MDTSEPTEESGFTTVTAKKRTKEPENPWADMKDTVEVDPSAPKVLLNRSGLPIRCHTCNENHHET